ncbi:unnamed protein product [Urochloa humidicola]
MSKRAARPGPSTGPPWPAIYRAVPGPALCIIGPCRASPRAPPTAQARARGPVSCRVSPTQPGTRAQAGPPGAQERKKIFNHTVRRCPCLRIAASDHRRHHVPAAGPSTAATLSRPSAAAGRSSSSAPPPSSPRWPAVNLAPRAAGRWSSSAPPPSSPRWPAVNLAPRAAGRWSSSAPPPSSPRPAVALAPRGHRLPKGKR